MIPLDGNIGADMCDDLTFTDKKGRTIKFNEYCTHYGLEAYCDGNKIGELDIVEPEDNDERVVADGPYRVMSIHIDEEFQRAGIGLEMYRITSEMYGALYVMDQDPMSENAPTIEGAALLNKAIKLRYILPFD
jgi:hypothetical protein